MKPKEISFRDLMSRAKRITFLVGAGCSIDPPSCLPSARSMMIDIIKFSCSEDQHDDLIDLVELNKLRFEQLIGIFRQNFNRNLTILDFFEKCDKPNYLHSFLAKMVKKGHFVVTTNFDFLIEKALLNLGIPKKKIRVIITKDDFQKYHNPKKLLKKGIYTIVKIHGSTKNIISDENTRDSLISTINALGKNKRGLNIFQLEDFKQPLVNRITNGQTLVIFGYSGSDDFDIIPTLKVLKNIKNIIWINHIANIKEDILRIDENTPINSSKFDNNTRKVFQILKTFCKFHGVDIFLINGNTSKLIKSLTQDKERESTESFNTQFSNWLSEKLPQPNKFLRNFFNFRIFSDLDFNDQALKSSYKMMEFSKRSNNTEGLAKSYNCIGLLQTRLNNYEKGLEYYHLALDLAKILDDKNGEAAIINNIAKIYRTLGNHSKALEFYNKALELNIKVKSIKGNISIHNNIGSLYTEQKKPKLAIAELTKALMLADKVGDLFLKGFIFTNIGNLIFYSKDYDNALKYYKSALEISVNLNNLSHKAISLANIGNVYNEQQKYEEALNYFKEALEIDIKLGDKRGEASRLHNVGSVYFHRGEHVRSLNNFERARKIIMLLGLENSSFGRTNLESIVHVRKLTKISTKD